ncbi:hypothetical protein ABZ656_25315, partial [Streptomyces sp. NPDC007095]|uniref:hypothetical protein n=1 Tax=Streptomyces sp. NPDC007095 TaxID=3154482 RepID=UPI0033F42E5D
MLCRYAAGPGGRAPRFPGGGERSALGEGGARAGRAGEFPDPHGGLSVAGRGDYCARSALGALRARAGRVSGSPG